MPHCYGMDTVYTVEKTALKDYKLVMCASRNWLDARGMV
jgi:hypothetical protein